MKNKLVISGNIALFEYPECDDPEFDLSNDGVLFAFGYKMEFAGKEIGTARRFELPLKGYRVFGILSECKDKIQGDYSKLLSKFDTDKILVMTKITQP